MKRSNRRLALFVLLSVAHTAVTLMAMRTHGFIGIFEAGLANWGAGQILSDLTVSLLLINTWLIADARRRGVSWLPYVLSSLALGSFPALVYVIRRELAAAPRLAVQTA